MSTVAVADRLSVAVQRHVVVRTSPELLRLLDVKVVVADEGEFTVIVEPDTFVHA